MTMETTTGFSVAETKAALDRAARDLAAAETKLSQRLAQLTTAETAVAAAAQRGTREEIAKACERRLIAKDEVRSARQAFSNATRVHSEADCEHADASAREAAASLVEKWNAIRATFWPDYESDAQTIVSAMASDLFIVEAAKRASRNRNAPTLRTRGLLISPDFCRYLSLPRLFPLPDGSRPFFWHPAHQIDRLKNAPLSELVPIASSGLGAPITSPDQWEGLDQRIEAAEERLFDLYAQTASRLVARLNNEWSIRREIAAANGRFAPAGMDPSILPSAWPGTVTAIAPAVEVSLPKLGSRDCYELGVLAS